MMATKAKASISEKQAEMLRDLPARMDIRVDWAFKHIFSKKKHLIKIIRDLLDMDIEIIEYMPNSLDVASENDKKSVLDVVCKDTLTDEVFVLEMQTTYESDMNDRLYYYGGSLIHNQVGSGAQKYDIKSVLVCCIASYRVPHNESVPPGKVFFRYRMLEDETHEVFDGDKLNICFLDLTRFDNYLDKDADLKKQWCWVFNNLTNFVERPENLDSSFDDIIKDAGTGKLTTKQKIKYMEALHLNERERLVVYEGGYMVGKKEGLAEGEAIGEVKMRSTISGIARNLLGMGMPVEDIATATGLTVEDVTALKVDSAPAPGNS